MVEPLVFDASNGVVFIVNEVVIAWRFVALHCSM
jgi:hypothetical protein